MEAKYKSCPRKESRFYLYSLWYLKFHNQQHCKLLRLITQFHQFLYWELHHFSEPCHSLSAIRIIHGAGNRKEQLIFSNYLAYQFSACFCFGERECLSLSGKNKCFLSLWCMIQGLRMLLFFCSRKGIPIFDAIQGIHETDLTQ